MSKKIKKAQQKIADLRRELSSESALLILDNLEKEWGRPVPVEVRRLVEFQADESDFEHFSQGFGIWEAEFYDGLKAGWSDNPEFLGKLYPFAQANGSGSTYAIWDDGEGYPMGDMPVVVFGDEGGQWVVANHFSEFLQLLTFDTEISVNHDFCFFYKDEDNEENPDAEKFRQWFSEYYGYLPIVQNNEQANEILANAQAQNQQKFNDWLAGFGIETVEYEPDETAQTTEFDNMWTHPVPVELEKLTEFQQQESGFEGYAQGFGVDIHFRIGLEAKWGDNPDFWHRLYPFAQANQSAAVYAVWDNGSQLPVNQMPVVVFGDEGGEWVVAQNFAEFLQLLSYDQQIYVDTACCYFHKNEAYAPSKDAEKYRNWLEQTFGIAPLNDESKVATIVIDAQAEYQEAFGQWLAGFRLATSDESLQVASLPPQLVQEEAPKHYNINGDKYPQAWAEEEYEYGGDEYDGDYSEVEAEFELIEFLPRLPEPYKLEQFERLWVDLHFKTNVPCQVWLLQSEGYNGTYASSSVYPVGERKTNKFLNFHQVPEHERIDHLILHIAFVNGQALEAKIPFDCQITPPSDTDTLYDGKGTTELNGEVTLVVGGNTLRLNEAQQIPVGVDVDVIIPYKTGSQYGINLFSMPVEGMEQCGSNYPIGFNGSDEYYGPWGVATATFSAYAPCKPPYLQVYAQNLTGGMQIFSQNIPINIEFIETEGDGQSSEITFAGIRLAGEEDFLQDKATIDTETNLELHYEYKNASEYGIYFKLYSVKNDEISEQILQSNTLADPNRTWGYIDFVIDEAQKIDDFILVMYNTAGEVLQERLLQLKLNVEEYDRPRQKAQREEDSKPTGLFGSLKQFLGLD